MPQDPDIVKEQLNQLSVIISELQFIYALVQNGEGPKSLSPLITDVAERVAELLDSLGGHSVPNDDTALRNSSS